MNGILGAGGQQRLKSILRYPGGKYRLAPWIVSHLPAHDVYLEPFCGGAAVLFAKFPARVETISDIDGRVANLFRVARERSGELARAVALTPYARSEYDESDEVSADPVEDARRFLVRCWMAHGGKFGTDCAWRHDMRGRRRGSPMPVEWANLPERLLSVVDRLRSVHVECRPATEMISAAADGRILIYADPPYPEGTLYERSARYYTHRMGDDDHRDLLDALDRHPGPVVLSGYACPLYDDRLTGWTRVDRPVLAYRNSPRVESLWLNPAAAAAQPRTLPLFSEQPA